MLTFWFLLLEFCLLLLPALWAQTTEKHRVLIVENPASVVGYEANFSIVKAMFQSALKTYTQKSSSREAWSSFFHISSKDVVGIKINASGGTVMSTRKALVNAIAESLMEAGVPSQHIIVWDKYEDDLYNANYLPLTEDSRYLVKSVIPQTGFDPKVFYVNEILGKLIWGDMLFQGLKPSPFEKKQASDSEENVAKLYEKGVPVSSLERRVSNKSFYAKIVTQICSKIINVPVFCDNPNIGLNGCLASLALGMVDNTRRFQGEGVWGDPAIAEILDQPIVRKKVILHVMDALIAGYAGGPQFSPEYAVVTGSIYLSTDPVAIDSIVLPQMDAWRSSARIPPLSPYSHYIQTAEEYGLGIADSRKIQVLRNSFPP
ncbi:hypothetical protein A946_00385 [Methylacidiphilum kamchatkense Kam1]|uniref:DUF362 domain-containing protein n=1 Tax=Methylacidiphilum kamchatkense Kam1 TaxID=1202785 RepID=A0A0C1RWA5_9BACT|nr:DUF362 domain-containing protein [Methylacidiphilum kamchatkense]KIE59226.1 hypothetical protein A946_00385 [Methylacidiphilum kamchatkense Kam1]QDQ42813.1 putative protein DUF362 [Methylacidiphilum kamchatkense Kam1]